MAKSSYRAQKECLVAHIVLREETNDIDGFATLLYEHLKENLPNHMIPTHYKIRKSMPVHSNGKRDVEALRDDIKELKKWGNTCER